MKQPVFHEMSQWSWLLLRSDFLSNIFSFTVPLGYPQIFGGQHGIVAKQNPNRVDGIQGMVGAKMQQTSFFA